MNGTWTTGVRSGLSRLRRLRAYFANQRGAMKMSRRADRNIGRVRQGIHSLLEGERKKDAAIISQLHRPSFKSKIPYQKRQLLIMNTPSLTEHARRKRVAKYIHEKRRTLGPKNARRYLGAR